MAIGNQLGPAAAGGTAAGSGSGLAGLLSGPFAPLLMAFGPALISKLFGGDPQAQLRKRIAKLTGAENVGRLTNQHYQNALASPAYSQAQGTIAAGANQAGANLQGALGARGIGTSGSAAVLSSLIPSLVGNQQAGLRTSAYQGAQSQAQNQIQAMIAALQGTQGPSQTQQYLGAGLSSFAPFLENYLKSKGNVWTGG